MSKSDHEFAQAETLLRQRLGQLADHSPTYVPARDEISVVASSRPARRGRRAGVIAAVTALIGAGGFTTYAFLGAGNDGGASTPEEAVSTFVSAVEHEDVLGVIDVTMPEEVGALRSALDSTTADAKRVDLLSDDFNANGVKGVDVSVDDLALDTEFLEGGLAVVTATSGTVNVSFDPRAFPFGDKVRALIGDSAVGGTASTSLGNTGTRALLVTVQRDGRWYVSLEYTVAEYIRRASGWEMPGAVSRTPVGFDSPEQAATGFYDRLGALDLRGAFDTFAPGEDAMAWLAQAWMTDAESAIDSGRHDGWTVALSNLTYDTSGSGDRLTLEPATFKLEGTVPATFNQDTSNSANPSWSTVVSAFDGSGYTLLPPGQVPATIDGLHFTDTFPAVGSNYNFTSAGPDGKITPLAFASEPTSGPQPFTIERSAGCTTFIGQVARSMFVGSVSAVPSADGSRKLCGPGDPFGGVGLITPFHLLTQLPSIAVVQTAGKWYVSPLGTLLSSVTGSVHDVKGDASLFDSPLAPFLYGGLSRSMLVSAVTGTDVATIGAACLPALTVADGKVTGVVGDPPVDAVRACSDGAFSSSSTSSSGGTVVVAATPVPASSTLGTTP
ncbi:MAG: hypothetical protein ABI949_06425 [Ilumatobacteraceae bacterium]